MVDDDYEILPHQELEYLRKEVERLKGNPTAVQTTDTLLGAMNNLTKSINKLLSVLETANDEMLRDYEENRTVKHMQKLEAQNEKIATAVVSLGEVIKEQTRGQPQEAMPEIPSDSIPSLSGMAPPPKRSLDDVPFPPQ